MPRLRGLYGWVWGLRLTRDTVLFCLGAFGYLHELLIPSFEAERPVILTVSAAMMGLPIYLRTVERLRNGKNGQNGER